MKKFQRRILLLGLVFGVIVSGCATAPKLSHDQIIGQYKQIADLEQDLGAAKREGVDYLAPTGYQQAEAALGKALAAAASGNTEAANRAAAEGAGLLSKMDADAETSRDILREVLEVRDRATRAAAPTLFADETADMEKDLVKVTRLIEQGKLEDAKEIRPELISGYSRLELLALKEATVVKARAAIGLAKKSEAEKLAPKTLKLSEEELALAEEILNTDRSQQAKSAVHAERAQWLAEQASAISELVKDFDRRDYSMEDIVLWYQEQLTTINSPRGGELPFNRDNREVVLDLQRAVAAAGTTKIELERRLAAAEAMLQTQSELSKEELARLQQERQDQDLRESEDQQRFEFVQSLFTESEANVYRQRRNVLIAAHGFHFPSGQSEITSENFEILNKIVQAIKTFPNSKIVVSGHTDSVGEVELNQRLSEQRAEKVAMFLNEVGGVSPARISFQGYGESRPVATNDTPQGRATNRRVEFLIVNP